jgi:hypothetical protein
MFTKHGQSTLWEFSEMMHSQYGAQVAVLVGYLDFESDPAIMLCVSHSILELYHIFS